MKFLYLVATPNSQMFTYLTHYIVGRIPESDTGNTMLLCCSCVDSKKPLDSPSPSPIPIVFSNDRCFTDPDAFSI